MEPEDQEATAADVGSLDEVVPPEPVVNLPQDIPLAPDGAEAELVRRIADALPKVFTFMGSNQWEVAAGNLVSRLSITSGDGPNDLRLI